MRVALREIRRRVRHRGVPVAVYAGSMVAALRSPVASPDAGGGGVPSPQPVPPLPGADVPGIELPPDPTQVPPGSPVGPDIEGPPPEPQQPVPVREPPGSPLPEHVGTG